MRGRSATDAAHPGTGHATGERSRDPAGDLTITGDITGEVGSAAMHVDEVAYPVISRVLLCVRSLVPTVVRGLIRGVVRGIVGVAAVLGGWTARGVGVQLVGVTAVTGLLLAGTPSPTGGPTVSVTAPAAAPAPAATSVTGVTGVAGVTGSGLATVSPAGVSPGLVAGGTSTGVASGSGCSWWDFACQGSTAVADAGLAAVTQSIAAGAGQLLGEIVRVLDASTQVPLADPTYQRIYTGFLGLAVPLVGVVLFAALVSAGLRRDPATLARAVVGVVFAGLGGVLYIVFAQLLVGVDNWLAHGIVAVTGFDLADSLSDLAAGFGQVAGARGQLAANMLLIVLMLVMLVAGLVLWFVLVLRQIAILVVVAFAPLLIAGTLWAPTRPWVRRATEVLVALVFTKSAIYALVGIGMALLTRAAEQTVAGFVGALVLLIGACFTPLLTLRLVHFAADTQIAGDMMATLRGGTAPLVARVGAHVPGHFPGGHDRHGGHGGGSEAGSPASSRHDNARHQAQAPRTDPTGGGGLRMPGPRGPGATPDPASPSPAGPAGPGAASGTSGGGAAGAAGAGGAAVGPLMAAAMAAQAAQAGGGHAQSTAAGLAEAASPHPGPTPAAAGDGSGSGEGPMPGAPPPMPAPPGPAPPGGPSAGSASTGSGDPGDGGLR
jgi:hypothetical protein